MSQIPQSQQRAPADPPAVGRGHLPQLDGLRVLAVMGVFFAHWGIASLPGFSLLPWGEMGVTLFFVLSGYLITGILISAADRIAAGHDSYWHSARQFYVRRVLRIFPIYYLVLFAVTPVILQVRQAFWWHLTYTSNVYFAIRGNFDIQGATFWTLASEEQFYLIWPWIILFVGRDKRRSVILLMIGLGIATRAVLSLFPATQLAAGILLPGCIPFFGLGALAALRGGSSRRDTDRPGKQVLRWLPIAGLVLFALSLRHWSSPVATGLIGTLGSVGWGLVSAWIVENAASGFGGPIGRALQFGPMVFLGRISYGLYMYHPFVSWAVYKVSLAFGINTMDHLAMYSPLYALATIGAATVSWYAIEQPINRLKRFFPY